MNTLTSNEYNERYSRKVPIQLGDLEQFVMAFGVVDDYIEWMRFFKGVDIPGNGPAVIKQLKEARTLALALYNAPPPSETCELPPVRRFRPLVEGGHIHSMSEVGNPNGHGGWHVEYVLAVDYDKLARRSEPALEPRTESILDRKVTVCASCLCASCWQGDFYCDNYKTASTVDKTVRELFQINANGVREDSGYWFKDVDTGKVDYYAKSAAKRAFNALSEGSVDG